MKRTLLTNLFFILLTIGCNTEVSIDPNDYVGEYVFRPFYSKSEDTERFASFLILKKDFTAVEIRTLPDFENVMVYEKKWRLFTHPGIEPRVSIGDRGHPIEKSGKVIKLINNYDLGMYYEKVR